MGKDLTGKELGEGIYQRKDGTYEGRYVDRFSKRRSVYSNSLKTVKQKLKKAKAEDASNKSVLQTHTLDEWHGIWETTYKGGIKDSTRSSYTTAYRRRISPLIGFRKLQSITQVDIVHILKSIEKDGLSYDYCKMIKGILYDMFEKAEINDYVIKNPVRGINLMQVMEDIINEEEDTVEKSLSYEEEKEFFKVAVDDWYYNLFVVAVNTGLRVGELGALTWDDIHLDGKYISISKTLHKQRNGRDTEKSYYTSLAKSRTSIRTVPINSKCEEALTRQQKQLYDRMKLMKRDNPENLVFTTKHFTPIGSRIVNRGILRVVSKMDVSKLDSGRNGFFTAHTFRHTFATRCFEAGISLKVVQTYLGHASMDITSNVYTHVTKDLMSTELLKLEELYKDLNGK